MTEAPAASPVPDIAQVSLYELWTALKAGIWDFRRATAFGLFFSAFYVAAGLLLVWLGAGALTWTLTLSLGFPLVAPFAAVGLYEVSRRIEADEPLHWAPVLAAVVREKDRQLPWLGVILVLIFLFWSFFAHMLFALFVGPSQMFHPIGIGWLLSAQGLPLVAIELLAGGLVAAFTFAITVVGLPLLVDKELDFVTAMLISLRATRANLGVFSVWAAIVAALLLLAMLPLFLGLFLVLPVLGHATWHIYRRVIYHEL